MTKLLLTTALSTLIAFSAYSNAFAKAVANPTEPAQQTERMPKHHKGDKAREPRSDGKMDKFLDLTDEQKAKAKEIREQSRKEIEPLMKEMKTLREKMDKIREADMKKFEALLTPEQKAKLEARKKHHEKEFDGREGHRFPPRDFKDFSKHDKD